MFGLSGSYPVRGLPVRRGTSRSSRRSTTCSIAILQSRRAMVPTRTAAPTRSTSDTLGRLLSHRRKDELLTRPLLIDSRPSWAASGVSGVRPLFFQAAAARHGRAICCLYRMGNDESGQRWPSQLWLVRHGESAGTSRAASRSRGASSRSTWRSATSTCHSALPASSNPGCSDTGLRSSPTDGRPNVVMTSPYLRAVQTAELICRGRGPGDGPIAPGPRRAVAGT